MEIEHLKLTEELGKRREVILRELKRRTLWFIQLRWLVPPSIVAGVILGLLLKVEFTAGPLLMIALIMFVYNTIFYVWSLRLREGPGWKPEDIKSFTYLQVVLDYTAMFLLIHYTGGAASPFIFFFIFHIIFASILLPPRSAYAFSVLAAAGVALTATGEYLNWLTAHPMYFRGKATDLAQQPFHMMVELGFFTASVFITAFSVTTIMPIFRKRIQNLAELSEMVMAISKRLNALYVITKTISSANRFQAILDIVTTELAKVMSVRGITIKLLSEDGKQLRYASVYGLPPEFSMERIIEVDKSPINRRIIEGEPFVIGNLTRREQFQLAEDLAAAKIKSVLFVSLKSEDRVIGILGAYSNDTERFGIDELDFFRLAAGIVAVALDNARAFEEIEKLDNERFWFMMRVTHNLRAPLNANQSIINMMQGGFLGDLNESQKKYMIRIAERSQAMITTLNELMTLAETRNVKRKETYTYFNLNKIACSILDTFTGQAMKKDVSFNVSVSDNLPEIQGDPEMIEQMLENLVSNGIKYTPRGGKVSLEISDDSDGTIKIVLKDTGIGIPKDAMPRLFTEFFRAENARKIEEVGTGLGLAIVRDIVHQHQGRIAVDSEEGCGTTFTIHLPFVHKQVVRAS